MLKQPALVQDGAKPVDGCDFCGEFVAVCDICGKEAKCIPPVVHGISEMNGKPVMCPHNWPAGWKLQNRALRCEVCVVESPAKELQMCPVCNKPMWVSLRDDGRLTDFCTECKLRVATK